jgi:hypothetical protein
MMCLKGVTFFTIDWLLQNSFFLTTNNIYIYIYIEVRMSTSSTKPTNGKSTKDTQF